MSEDIEDRARAIKHHRIDLLNTNDDPLGNHPHRPEISVKAEWDADLGGTVVSICLSALWGQPTRYVDMTCVEARQLMTAIMGVVEALEHEHRK